jgi:hypothetical protein
VIPGRGIIPVSEILILDPGFYYFKIERKVTKKDQGRQLRFERAVAVAKGETLDLSCMAQSFTC